MILIIKLVLAFVVILSALGLLHYLTPLPKWYKDRWRERWRLLTLFKLTGYIIFPVGLGLFLSYLDLRELKTKPWDEIAATPYAAFVVFLSIVSYYYLLMSSTEQKINKEFDDYKQRSENEIKEEQRARKAAEAVAEESERQFKSTSEITNYVDAIVGTKANSVWAFLESSQKKLEEKQDVQHSCIVCREVLQPEEQIHEQIRGVHQFFSPRLKPDQKLRVAYYEPEDEYLSLRFSYNGVVDNCISSPSERHQARFQLDDGDALAVDCARGSEPLILIPDTAQGSSNGEFVFFNDSQQEHLKSIFAYRFEQREHARDCLGVLCVDSDKANFFGDEDKPIIKRLCERIEPFALIARYWLRGR